MKNDRKLLTARQLANSPPALAHTEIDRKKMGRKPKLVIDRLGWPDDDERLTGTWGAQVTIKALRSKKPEFASRHLRDDKTPSRHVWCLLADMMHPGPECRELVRFKIMHRKSGKPKVVCDHSGWPGPEERLIGERGERTAVEGLRCGKLELAARHLRDDEAFSERFRLLLADMSPRIPRLDANLRGPRGRQLPLGGKSRGRASNTAPPRGLLRAIFGRPPVDRLLTRAFRLGPLAPKGGPDEHLPSTARLHRWNRRRGGLAARRAQQPWVPVIGYLTKRYDKQ
jgi:hypothetical protein